MNPTQLLDEIAAMEQSVAAVPPAADLQQQMLFLEKLMGHQSRSGSLVADAQLMFEQKRGEVSEKYIADRYAKASKRLVESLIDKDCAVEAWIYKRAERLNRGIVHLQDCTRTLISAGKEEMRMQQYGGGGFVPAQRNDQPF